MKFRTHGKTTRAALRVIVQIALLLSFLLGDPAMASQALKLENVINARRDTISVVLDFPSGQHQEVVESIRTYWAEKANATGKELVLVSSDQASALKNPILYGTFAMRPDNPVFRAFDGTPLAIIEREAANFSGDIRAIIVGKNQYGIGFMAIFAATTPALLPDLHRFLEVGKSLIVASEAKVIQTQIFDNQFRTLIPDVKISDALGDADWFFKIVEEVHPHPLANLKPEEYLSLKKGALENLRKSAGDSGVVKASTLAWELAKVAASLKDGHTSVGLGPFQVDETDPSRVMLPFRLDYWLGDLRVGAASKEFVGLTDQRLVTIDGTDVNGFFTPILEVVPGETLQYKLTSFVRDQRTYWALLSPIHKDSMVVVTEHKEGEPESRVVPLLSLEDYDKLVPSSSKPGVSNQYTYYDKKRICYYRFDSFDYTDEQKQYIDDLFEELHSKEVEALLIDLRHNCGGNSKIGDYILDYLTSKPYRSSARMDVKLSKTLIERVKYYEKFEPLTGLTISRRSDPHTPEDRGLKFAGKLHVLIGPRTFSSACMFTAIVKDYGLGTLIGEETGCARQSFGETLNFKLPESELRFRVSCKLWFAPIPQPDDEYRGTVPDIPVNRRVLRAYPEAEDPVLEFALDQIRRQLD